MTSILAAALEAIRATILPCSFLLVVPPALATVAAGATRAAVATVALTAATVGWLLLVVDGLASDGVARAIAVAAIVAVGVAVRTVVAGRPVAPPTTAAQVGLVAVSTAAATVWWRPCVGPELGSILNAGSSAPLGQAPAMAAYMIGAMVPVAGLAFAVQVADPGAARLRWLQVPAAVALAALSVAVVAGRHDAVAGTLARWSVGT